MYSSQIRAGGRGSEWSRSRMCVYSTTWFAETTHLAYLPALDLMTRLTIFCSSVRKARTMLRPTNTAEESSDQGKPQSEHRGVYTPGVADLPLRIANLLAQQERSAAGAAAPHRACAHEDGVK